MSTSDRNKIQLFMAMIAGLSAQNELIPSSYEYTPPKRQTKMEVAEKKALAEVKRKRRANKRMRL